MTATKAQTTLAALGSQTPWHRLGLIHERYCFVPTPIQIRENEIRLYVAFVGADQIGHLGYIDIDSKNPKRIIRESTHCVMPLGDPGTFDDNGITPICAFHNGNDIYLYYTGWQLQPKIRYFLFTGLAISTDGGETFQRYSQVPVLDRCNGELTVRTAAHVLKEDGIYKCWYIAGSETIIVNDKQVPTYTMFYTTSNDGFSYGKGQQVMTLDKPYEFGFGRPYVRKTRDGYEMWYSIRRTDVPYLIGYAVSRNGIDWARQDHYGLNVDPEGSWDSNMVAFPGIISTNTHTFMFYNGNDYGKGGLGVAVLRRDESDA